MEIRSFLAFEQPPEIRGILDRVSGELRKSRLDVRWVKPENIHLTIVFLGNYPERGREGHGETPSKALFDNRPVSNIIEGNRMLSQRPKPEGALDRAGRGSGKDGGIQGFPPGRLILWGPQRGQGLQTPPDPGPVSQLGKGGPGTGSAILTRYRDLASPVCPLNELILFKSELRPGGSFYTQLASWPLTGIE